MKDKILTLPYVTDRLEEKRNYDRLNKNAQIISDVNVKKMEFIFATIA